MDAPKELPKELQDAIAAMMANDGFYVIGNTSMPEQIAPMAVIKGKLYSMKIDEELDPTRFNATAMISGPAVPYRRP